MPEKIKNVRSNTSSFILPCSLFVILFSCSPYKFTTSKISSSNGDLKVKVPRGFVKKETNIDSAGNKEQLFLYRGGATLYVTEAMDSMVYNNAYIDPEMNIPRDHFTGGKVYKGMLPGPLYWREIRMNGLRVGYRNVSTDNEISFDSSTNYISKELMKVK